MASVYRLYNSLLQTRLIATTKRAMKKINNSEIARWAGLRKFYNADRISRYMNLYSSMNGCIMKAQRTQTHTERGGGREREYTNSSIQHSAPNVQCRTTSNVFWLCTRPEAYHQSCYKWKLGTCLYTAKVFHFTVWHFSLIFNTYITIACRPIIFRVLICVYLCFLFFAIVLVLFSSVFFLNPAVKL